MKNAALVGIAYILAPFLGPTLGPLIGAYVIHQYEDWRWVVWVVLCIMAPVGVALLFMKETSKSRILHLRVKTRGGHVEEKKPAEVASTITKAVLRPLHMCIIEVGSPSSWLRSSSKFTLYSRYPSFWVFTPRTALP